MEKVHPDWKEFLQLLRSHGVKYMIVGGHAVAVHGHPRATADIDVFFSAGPENIVSLEKALQDFGYRDDDLARMLSTIPQIIMLGREPFRIDLLNQIDGIDFDAAYKNTVSIHWGEVEAVFISKEDLIANKIASGRRQDLADVEALSKIDS